jgi:hypothetical protein
MLGSRVWTNLLRYQVRETKGAEGEEKRGGKGGEREKRWGGVER